MSRVIVFVAFVALLSVSAVSAQQQLWVQSWTNSNSCNTTASVVNSTVSTTGSLNVTTGAICNVINITMADNSFNALYQQLSCNTTTGLITAKNFANDSCSGESSDVEYFQNGQCTSVGNNTETYVKYWGCDIIQAGTTLPPTTIPPVTNGTQAPNGTTQAPTTIAPTATPTPAVNTTQPPVKGAAFQAGASLIAAAVAVIISLF